MPLIDLRCAGEPAHDFEYMRPLAEWPATPACLVCGAATVQLFLPKAVPAGIDPIVIYRAPDGTYRYPGDADGAGARKYDRMGYTRLEARSGVEMHRLETRINRDEQLARAPKVEMHARMREMQESAARSQLRDSMRGFSDYGKDVARAAMRIGDAKPRQYTRIRDPLRSSGV